MKVHVVVTLLALEDSSSANDNPAAFVRNLIDDAEQPGTVEYEVRLGKTFMIPHPDIPTYEHVDWLDEAASQPYVTELNKAYGEWSRTALKAIKEIWSK